MHKPLAGAHIFIRDSGKGVFSGSDGSYSLTNLPEGKVKLTFSFVGYYQEIRNITIKTGRPMTLDVVLTPKIIESAEVEISDNRPRTYSQEFPVRMEIINSNNILNTPGQNITSVLDYIPGVNLSTTMGIFANNTVVSMRGLSGTDQGRTLVLLDDVPLNKADQGSVNWNLINRDNVDRIEVTKGPGNAMYGSSAMGGVINIITKRPSRVVSGTATLDYGTFNTAGFRYQIAGKPTHREEQKGFSYSLNGFYRRSDGYNSEIPEYLEKSDTFYVNNFLREASIGLKIGYQFNPLNLVEVSANFFNDKRGRGIEIYEVDGAYERHNTWQTSVRYHGGVGKIRWNLLAYNQNEHFERLNEAMKDGEYNLYLVKSNRVDQGAQFYISIPAGKQHLLTAGIDYQGGKVDGNDIYYTSTDVITNKGTMNTYAAFIQDEMKFFNKRLQINPGIRVNMAIFHDGNFQITDPSYAIQYLVDYQDSLFPRKEWLQIDPKLSIQYRFTPGIRIYLTLGQGFRAPNLDDLCRSGKISNGFKVANPGLKPEILDNIETGFDFILWKMIHIAPGFYYSIGRDFMYYVSTGDSVNMGYKRSPVFMKQNISQVKIFGCEVEVDINPFNWLTITANYTYNHSVIGKFVPYDSAVDKDLTGKFLTDVPMHKATAGATFTNKIANFNILWKYTGSRWINDENVLDPYLLVSKYPAYSTFSLRCWHTFFKRLTAAVNIDNIFDVMFIDDRLQKSPGRMITGEITIKF